MITTKLLLLKLRLQKMWIQFYQLVCSPKCMKGKIYNNTLSFFCLFKKKHTFGGKFDTYNFRMGIPSSVWVGTYFKPKGVTSRFELMASER